MNIKRLFENTPEKQFITDGQRELLNLLMNLNSPMDFNDNFATDEELDALEDALDLAELDVPHSIILKHKISGLPVKMAEEIDDFICG